MGFNSIFNYISKFNFKFNSVLKVVLILSLSLLVVMMVLIVTRDDVITFYLAGDGQVFIRLNDNYHEMGFVAVDSKGNDLSKYVKIKNFINNKQVGTYTVKYILKTDDFEKELTRLVKVTDISDSEYYIKLNGGNIVHHLLGTDYEDLGYNVYNNNDDIVDIDVEVSGNVNINQKGSYLLTYKIDYQGHTDILTRTVKVYDIEYEYTKSNESDGILMVFLVNKEHFKYVELPDGTIESNNFFSYKFLQNGSYNFDFYDIYGKFKRKTIEINEIDSNLYCEGIVNRYGTNLSIKGEDVSKYSLYDWYIDGVRYSDDNSFESLYKNVKEAYILVDNYDKEERILCSINNELFYDFKYDSFNNKPFIGCNTYNNYDRIILEEKMKNSIIQAGYGTRAGVVEAARFLVGALEYKIPYLGPKEVDSSLGRYNKIGLNIGNEAGWGCKVSGYIQGMDCTNFINWVFIQNGLTLKDVYATKNVYNLVDKVSYINVGDLLLTPNNDTFSHVGIIIGIDNENIYVAEATTGKINAIVVTKLDKSNLPKSGALSKVRLYNYNNDGNLTNMWVD